MNGRALYEGLGLGTKRPTHSHRPLLRFPVVSRGIHPAVWDACRAAAAPLAAQLPQLLDDLFNDEVRGRGAGRDADGLVAFKPGRVDLAGLLDVVSDDTALT